MADTSSERVQLDVEWSKLKAAQEQLAKDRKEFDAEREASGVEYKLFVGNLDASTTEAEIQSRFTEFGSIKECVLLTDNSGKSKCCGFVKYFSKAAAEKAIAAVNDKVTDKQAESAMACRYARQKSTATAQTLPGASSVFNSPMNGAGGAYSNGRGTSAYNPYGAGMNNMGGGGGGFGFGGYSSQQAGYGAASYGAASYGAASYGGGGGGNTGGDAGKCYDFLNKGSCTRGASCRWSHTGGSSRPSGGGMSSGRGPAGANLYVNQIDPSASEAEVRAMFSDFGNVLSVTLFGERGYGFVSFGTAAAAQAAMSALNGMQTGTGRVLEVTIKKERGTAQQGNRYAPY